nr:hypothetical protein JVH1_1681 [Rhodococcus sp. JVH1]
MSGHVWNGSAWERVKTMHVWNGTVWEQVREAWRWTGSGWEQLYARPISIVDDFNRANSSVIGPLWNKVGTNTGISSNTLAFTGSSDGSGGVVTVGQINNDDGYAEVVMGTMGSSTSTSDTSLFVRCNSTGTSALSLNIFNNKIYMSKFSHASGLAAGNNGQGMTDIASNTSVTIATGDTVRLEFVGDDYTVTRNGTTILTASDSSVPRGPGQRYGALRLERNPFANSAAINSFKLADLGA